MRILDKSRRNFLGLLAASPFTAQAAKAEAEKLLVSGVSSNLMAGGATAQPSLYTESEDYITGQKKYLSDQIKEYVFGGSKHAEIAKRMKLSVPMLEPDLAGLHSISLVKRYDMQRARNVDREMKYERDNLKKRLANLIAGKDEWA